MRGVRGALVLAVACVLVLGACGGADDNDSGERPTVEELHADIVASANVDDMYALCLADGLQMSTLPNGVIRRVAAGEDAEVDSDNVDAYEQILIGIKGTCDALGAPG